MQLLTAVTNTENSTNADVQASQTKDRGSAQVGRGLNQATMHHSRTQGRSSCSQYSLNHLKLGESLRWYTTTAMSQLVKDQS